MSKTIDKKYLDGLTPKQKAVKLLEMVEVVIDGGNPTKITFGIALAKQEAGHNVKLASDQSSNVISRVKLSQKAVNDTDDKPSDSKDGDEKEKSENSTTESKEAPVKEEEEPEIKQPTKSGRGRGRAKQQAENKED